MGLDNGICIRTKERSSEIPIEFQTFIYSDGMQNYEILYWRKCWGIRNAIIDYLITKHPMAYTIDNSDFSLNLADLGGIYGILCIFNNEEYWKENADSIWEWKEFEAQLKTQLSNMRWLISYAMRNPDADIYFYDSY